MILYKHTQTPGVYMPGQLNAEQSEAFDQSSYNAAINFAAHSGRNNLKESI